MASITQDMRFRLSLIHYAEKHGVSNAARKYKTNRQYIYRWKNAMMAPGILYVTVPDVPISTLTSILLMKSNLSAICAGEILMPASSSSG